MFRSYGKQMLAPALRPGHVVVMDNWRYKVADVAEAIQAVGASAMYLLPYAPDLNPIKQVFAKLKAPLREAEARTRDVLWSTIDTLVDAFAPAESQNCIINSGVAKLDGA